MRTVNRNLLLFGLVAMLAAAAPACGSSDSTPDGGDGNVGGSGGSLPPDTGGEDCFNAADDDEDGLVDCEDPDCFVLDECRTECAAQVPTCEKDLGGKITRVCLRGACAPAGEVSEEGEIVRGNVLVFGTLDESLAPSAQRNKAYSVEFLHPERPDGRIVSCDALYEEARFGASLADLGYNVIDSNVNVIAQAGQTIPAMALDVPVGDERGVVVLYRLWGAVQNGAPTGEVMALGCKEGVSVPPGPFVEDEAHTVKLDIEPVCRSGSKDDCPEPLTCQLGALLCRDLRCEDCLGQNLICREVDGEPRCLTTCDPETAVCPVDHRCDTTPGQKPACIPVD